MKRLFGISALVVVTCLMVSLNASAGTITGGASDAQLTSRTLRDGASGINFVDFSSTISGNGWITSFSVFAQSWLDQSVAPGWDTNNYDARQLALFILRDTGSNYQVVGTSPLETIPAGQTNWDKVYTFALPGNGIPVQKNDYIGWYYPFQGAAFQGPGVPGGVIAFSAGGHSVYWAPTTWGQGVAEVSGSLPYGYFQGYDNGRTYSINVQGTDVAPVPLPGALPLFASGLFGLAAIRRRFKK